MIIGTPYAKWDLGLNNKIVKEICESFNPNSATLETNEINKLWVKKHAELLKQQMTELINQVEKVYIDELPNLQE